MNRLTLRFQDDGLEAGFASGRRPRLLRSLAACCAVTVVCFGISLAMQRPFDTDESTSRQRAHIMHMSNLAFASCAGLAVLAFAACCLLLRTGRGSTLALEVISVTLVCIGMVFLPVGLPFYTGRLLGYDPELYLERRHITDSGLLLSIDAFVTASHMALNVRFRYMLPIQVGGLMCYVLPAFFLGSPEGENAIQYFAVLLSLVVMAALGKHSFEYQERNNFVSLIGEKTLRVQSEFQLSNFQAGGVSLVGTTESAESVCDSVQSTTQSARKFMPRDGTEITPALLRDIALVGEKEQWLISRSELGLVPGRVLGEGGFGRVLLGRYQGISVAVKVPKAHGLSISSKATMVELCNELRILRKLRHPNIVFLYGACLDEQGCNLALILELVQGVSLDRFVLTGLHDRQGDLWERAARPPSEVERLQVLVDVTCALRYLHSRTPHVAHGDLKNGNVFVELRWGDRATPRAKLLDFGLARLRTRHAPPMGGTVRWMAPEVVARRPSSAKSTAADVYSFGRLAYFVVTGVFPFHGLAKPDVVEMLRSSQLPPMEWPLDAPTSSAHRAIVEECCSLDPGQRPSMSRVHRGVGSWHNELLLRQGLDSASLDGEPFDADFVFDARQDQPPRLQRPLSSESVDLPDRERQRLRGPAALPQAVFSPRSSRAAAPKYRLTPDDTVLAMVLEVLGSCNVEIPEGACCPFHGCLKGLGQVCRGLRQRECLQDWLGEGQVCGQCSSCGILIPKTGSGSWQQVRVCTFCDATQSHLSHSTGSGVVSI